LAETQHKILSKDTLSIGIVGGGPVGIYFAYKCLEKKFNVTLIDAGFEDSESSILSRKNYKFKTYSAMPAGVHRIGGGSAQWRGRVSEFQDFDFQNESKTVIWPYPKSELDKYYIDLIKDLNLEMLTDKEMINNYFIKEANFISNLFELRSYRFCKESFFVELFQKIKNHPNLTTLMGTYCEEIKYLPAKNIFEFELLNHNNQKSILNTNFAVIAGGTLQTTSLLLRSKALHNSYTPNSLGVFLMEHIEGYIGNLYIKNPQDVNFFNNLLLNVENRSNKYNSEFGVAISNKNTKSINIHYEIRNFMPKFLIRNSPKLKHGHFLVRASFKLLATIEKYFTYIPRIFFLNILKWKKISIYSVFMKAEELPNQLSTLSIEGKNNSVYNHKISDQTWQLIYNDISLFRENLKNKFNLKVAFYRNTRNINLLEKIFGPNWHPMGTARMGKYPENSIVDENLQIHGVNNCFVLSAAVFPTGSNSNPTFTVLTLARKLIDYITKI
jgi:hypothetical protein